MSFVSNSKTASRLWAAFHSDFEVVISKFLDEEGWMYEDFAKVANQCSLSLVMHCTQGKGKTKNEQYVKVMKMILRVAKSFWLGVVPEGKIKQTEGRRKVSIKRRIGGLFLTYSLYMKQPMPGHVKICIDMANGPVLVEFLKEMQGSPLEIDIKFIICALKAMGAFRWVLFDEEYRFEAYYRNFLNTAKSNALALTCQMRHVQDELAYSAVNNDTLMKLSMYTAAKDDLANDIMKSKFCKVENYKDMLAETNEEMDLKRDAMYESSLRVFKKDVVGGKLNEVFTTLHAQVDVPVLTLQTLTSTEAIGRRMMMEARNRMARLRKRREGNLATGSDYTAAQPYVNEGGIFGRKKEPDEEPKDKREKGQCSANLWNFITSSEFGKNSSKSN